MKTIRIISMATVSAGVIAGAMLATTAAHAQATPPAPESTAASPETPPATSEAAPNEPAIIVTGTRIANGGFESPTPVNVVNTDELIKRAPGTLADALNQLPVFQNSINSNQQQFTQGNRQRTGNYLNLRALGTQRVLVLQDGQRLPVTGTNGGVDASLIPQLLTQRIDVVTGGASAAYGSDAVSGVVNFIIDKHFEGIKAQGQFGLASRGYNKSYRLGLAAGTALADDRLHLIGSVERYHTDEVLRSDISSIGELWAATGAGTAADPILYKKDVGYNNTSAAGVTQTGPAGFINKQFGQNGELLPFNTGVPSGNPGTQQGGDRGFIGQTCCTITPGQTTTQVFGRAEYDFTDDISGFVSVGYNDATAKDYPVSLLKTRITVFRDNAFLAPSTVAALGNAASFDIGKTFNDQRGHEIKQNSQSLIINSGLKGKVFDSLDWNIGYTHAETTFKTDNIDVENAKFYAAADAVKDSSGKIVCRVTLTNPTLYPGCQPLNLFGTATESQAAYDYLLSDSKYRAKNKMDSVQANLSGTLFDGWAGPVSFAVGAEYRKSSLDQTTNSDPNVATDFTGLRGVLSGNGRLKYAFLNIGSAKGSYEIKEVYGELNVPVLKDSAVGSLEFNGAARYTHYSTSGGVTTWKAGAIYDPVDGVRFRGTVSRDIRAPTLFELFSGTSATTITFSDRLTGKQASSQQISGGNAGLRPEVANTLTAGVVLKPAFLPGFNFSADYFRIKISDGIGTPFSAFQIVDLCFASNFTSPLCNQVSRPLGATNPDPNNTPTAIFTNLQNISTQTVSGIDFEMSYTRPVGNGRITARAQATRQLTFEQSVAPGQPTVKYVGTADFNDVQFPLPVPKWRATLNLGFDSDRFSVNVQERIIGGYDRSHQFVYAVNKVPAIGYTDLNLTYRIETAALGKVELFATINNLFDRQPPLVPVARTPGLTVPTIRSAYDILGTYATAGVRIKI